MIKVTNLLYKVSQRWWFLHTVIHLSGLYY